MCKQKKLNRQCLSSENKDNTFQSKLQINLYFSQLQGVDLYDLLQDVIHVRGLHADSSQVQLRQEGREKHHHIVPDAAQIFLRGSDKKSLLNKTVAEVMKHYQGEFIYGLQISKNQIS